jgi:hypothetical protein
MKKIINILVNNRYMIFSDGCIYDTQKAKDIPKSIFKLRDILIFNDIL